MDVECRAGDGGRVVLIGDDGDLEADAAVDCMRFTGRDEVLVAGDAGTTSSAEDLGGGDVVVGMCSESEDV